MFTFCLIWRKTMMSTYLMTTFLKFKLNTLTKSYKNYSARWKYGTMTVSTYLTGLKSHVTSVSQIATKISTHCSYATPKRLIG